MFSLLLILFSFLYSHPSDLSREIPPKYFTPSGSIEALINDYDGIYYLVQLDLKNDSLYNIAKSILPDAELFNGPASYHRVMTSEHLSQGFIDGMDTAFENWKPREKYTLEAI